jgi:4-diphosphocytidyl-2-C-methyl-D-erythritol kinase
LQLQQSENRLIVQAPAKLNLSLRILARRPDGFHEIETVMVSIQHYDTLCFAPSSQVDISFRFEDLTYHSLAAATHSSTVETAVVPQDHTNLVVRAALLLKEYANVNYGAEILLQKRIPAAAGLAGGSSDAAATLAALNQLWNLRLTLQELSQLASRLGSDIPFFLCGKPIAVCRGRGEIIEPVELQEKLWFVVAKPPAGLSTALVYRHCQPTQDSPSIAPLLSNLAKGDQTSAAHALHNGLQAAAVELCPAIRQLESTFANLDVIAHQMSGSGTAYFGWCRSEAAAHAAAEQLTHLALAQVFVACSGL